MRHPKKSEARREPCSAKNEANASRRGRVRGRALKVLAPHRTRLLKVNDVRVPQFHVVDDLRAGRRPCSVAYQVNPTSQRHRKPFFTNLTCCTGWRA